MCVCVCVCRVHPYPGPEPPLGSRAHLVPLDQRGPVSPAEHVFIYIGFTLTLALSPLKFLFGSVYICIGFTLTLALNFLWFPQDRALTSYHSTNVTQFRPQNMYIYIYIGFTLTLCSADGSTHTASNKLYRKVKHWARPNLLHANGQSAPRSGGACDVGRGAGSHTPSTASESFSPLLISPFISLRFARSPRIFRPTWPSSVRRTCLAWRYVA